MIDPVYKSTFVSLPRLLVTLHISLLLAFIQVGPRNISVINWNLSLVKLCGAITMLMMVSAVHTIE